MGRRKRLLREAIQSGQVESLSQWRDRLMFEVIRRASWSIINDRQHDNDRFEQANEWIGEIVIGVLPYALDAVGKYTFSVNDLCRRKDWHELYLRMIDGVLINMEQFVQHSRVDWWKLRKRKSRPLTGKWKLCVGCGVPRYRPPSQSKSRWCRECWRKRKSIVPLDNLEHDWQHPLVKEGKAFEPC